MGNILNGVLGILCMVISFAFFINSSKASGVEIAQYFLLNTLILFVIPIYIKICITKK